jgi:hypothetical protein
MLHSLRTRLSNRSRTFRATIGLFVMAVLLLGVAPARAGSLDIIVESTTAAPGTVGQFDVVLQNNSASAVNIASFSVDVLLSDTTNVNFTGINNATITPYIFSLTGSSPPGFTGNLLPMEASGMDLSAGAQVVNPGDTWGLADISYLVDPAAPLGTIVPVALELTPVFLPPSGGTSLLDPTGAPVPFSMVDGTITVGTASVPEPASVTLLAISSLAVVLGNRFARRVRARLGRD